MSVETVAIASAIWLWESYGKEITDSTVDKFKARWAEFKWQDAEEKYRSRLREFCSTVRVLGNPKPINLDEIFTDVYVLDKPTAFRRFDIHELQANPLGIDILQSLSEKRKNALSLVLKKKRLFILGKPGAGKTTFMKYLVLKTIDRKYPRTPIFISLREWADTNIDLLDFIVEQFEICSFPDPKPFVLKLLSSGKALVLFDGLDEVNVEGNQRAQMISTLTNFAKRYENTHICLTCRIAATDYSFDQFTYLEIADFDQRQQDSFVCKWYQDNNKNLGRFQSEFNKLENRGLRDLARTPLLLTLLCLAFDETLSFPNRRVDLYKESIDALLKKWDSSRGIKRDEVYRKLSPARKEQMLARIAAENFESGGYFVAQEKIEKQITNFLHQLPDTEGNHPDGEIVLKAMESQHGILVERAHNIYSFSHLTFQEYLTARYIVENAANGTLERLIIQHNKDERWREVFLLTASLLDNADKFFNVFLFEIGKNIENQDTSKQFFCWTLKKAKLINSENPLQYLPIVVLYCLLHTFSDDFIIRPVRFVSTGSDPADESFLLESRDEQFSLLFSLSKKSANRDFSYNGILNLINLLTIKMKHYPNHDSIANKHREIMLESKKCIDKISEIVGVNLTAKEVEALRSLSIEDLSVINNYMKTLGLFSSCLSLASLSDRKKTEDKFLSTITSD